MPSFSAMLNQLSAAPVLSSTCSHRPAALGSLTAGAAQARAFRATRTATTPRHFIDDLATFLLQVPSAFCQRQTAAISRKDQRDAEREKGEHNEPCSPFGT